jgi:hypothetical protein
MKDMQKEWKTYTKRVILKRLYIENRDQSVTDFLENYDLLKVNVLSHNAYEFRMEILFKEGNEILKIIGQFKPWGAQRFYWTMPGKIVLKELQEILEKFNFDHYIEEKI